MYRYEVKMSTIMTDFIVIVLAENKAKAKYKAYTMWKGKELSEKCSFGMFLKYFFNGIKQLN